MKMLKEKVEKIDIGAWRAPQPNGNMPHGDMPGDKILIGEDHIAKANKIFPVLLGKLAQLSGKKAVVSVFGGSGTGKSEVASLLTYYLQEAGIGAYVLSGDNYPRRIPLYNDAERLAVFRSEGLKGLVASGLYSPEVQKQLSDLWNTEKDPDPKLAEGNEWLKEYQRCGRNALSEYLGTRLEQDYDQVNQIIRDFKSGKEKIWLKRMGRSEDQRWYDEIDFSNTDVLLIEWTHGGNENIEGLDIPVLLNSTPEETREHRRLRARDGKTDSDFTTMVLEIEQAELDRRAEAAEIIISKAGELLRPVMN